MKKISLSLFLALAFAASSMAKSVVFTLTDGTEVYYLLGGEKNPVMKFSEGKIVVNTDKYELSDIKNFRISDTDDPNGIEQVLDRNNVSFANNQFVVKTASAKAVGVYSANGAQVKAAIASDNGYTKIDLAGLPAGVYVIKAGGCSFKVMKK